MVYQMAVIQKREGKQGITYRVLIRKSGHKSVSKSFSKKALAKEWMSKTEFELDRDLFRNDKATLKETIDRYFREAHSIKPFGASKKWTLELLSDRLGHLKLTELTSKRLQAYAVERSQTICPASIKIEMLYIGGVLSAAESLWGAKPKIQDYKTAMLNLKQLDVICNSEERTRRASNAELSLIKDNVIDGSPVPDWVDFAVATAMRRGEIGSLLWNDLSEDGESIIIRERKHPRKKKDEVVPLLPAARDVIARQVREDSDRKVYVGKGKNKRLVYASELIFPQNSQSVAQAFKTASKRCGVEDLRFHDLRHEAISRLFEMGLDSIIVAVFSGHKDINMLRRYTHPDAQKILGMIKTNTKI